MTARSGSKQAIYAALIGNILIAISKFTAAILTGSSAMTSEAVHSLVDTSNEIVLLYGIRRASRPADRSHPLGYGRELYFWSFIVALLIFALGAGVSFYEGVIHIREPEPVQNVEITYAVLLLSALFEGYSWSVALKAVRQSKGSLGYLAAARKTKDLTIFTVLFEDTAALLGIAVALAGIALAQGLGMPVLDGIASIGIAVILAASAIFLARESKGLLIGEPAAQELRTAVLHLAAADPDIHRANGLITVHLAPRQIVAALSAEFRDAATAPQIEACVQRIETKIKSAYPEVSTLFVKPQTAATWAALHEQLGRSAGSSKL
ncbi:MAG: cation diffusion facilitator family transporter [Pseudomonadota bacterium]